MTSPSQSVAAPYLDVSRIVDELRAARTDWRLSQGRSLEPRGRDLPSREVLQAVMSDLHGLLFPMRLGPPDLRQHAEDFYIGTMLDRVLHTLDEQIQLELHHSMRHAHLSPREVQTRARHIVQAFAASLPATRRMLDTDVLAAYHGDPAAHSVDEVLLCYPGVTAIINHRLAHTLYTLGATLLARLIAELSHASTGIDIHPGASIGASFFIDHGTGVVIGETAVIGKRVRIYQAVTLGAKRFPTDANGQLEKGAPRHPVIGDDVVIYAGATLLGRITVGARATLGGNVWVTHDVAEGAVLTLTHSHDAAAQATEPI